MSRPIAALLTAAALALTGITAPSPATADDTSGILGVAGLDTFCAEFSYPGPPSGQPNIAQATVTNRTDQPRQYTWRAEFSTGQVLTATTVGLAPRDRKRVVIEWPPVDERTVRVRIWRGDTPFQYDRLLLDQVGGGCPVDS